MGILLWIGISIAILVVLVILIIVFALNKENNSNAAVVPPTGTAPVTPGGTSCSATGCGMVLPPVVLPPAPTAPAPTPVVTPPAVVTPPPVVTPPVVTPPVVVTPPTTTPAPIEDTVSRATNIADCGYASMKRGWYNMTSPSLPPFNDYCRFVGNPPVFMCVPAAQKSNPYVTPSLGIALAGNKYPYQPLKSGDSCYGR